MCYHTNISEMGVQNPDNTDHIEYVEVAMEIAFLVTGALVAKRSKSSLKRNSWKF